MMLRNKKQGAWLQMKYFIFLFVINIVILVSAQTTAEPPENYFDADSGTEDNPFQIGNLANLRWLSENNSYWGSPMFNNGNLIRYYYIQTADIDATETIEWNEGRGFLPMGLPHFLPALGYETEFFSHYDGNNFKIINLYQSPISDSGLFGATWGSVLKNINLQNITIQIEDNYGGMYGTLVGTDISSSITNCSVSGIMDFRAGDLYGAIGGLLGQGNRSKIEFCYSNVRIIGGEGSDSSAIGGLVGSLHQDDGVLKNSYFNGDIYTLSTSQTQGGLVGWLGASKIENCYVTSTNNFNYVDKLVGRFFVPSHPSHTDCIIENNFWDIQTTGITALSNTDYECETILNNFGKTTDEMKQASTYTQYGWDFENVWGINPEINNGYPYLLSHLEQTTPSIDIIDNTYMSITAFPNPFNPEIILNFTLHKDSYITIDIYNIKGQHINTIVQGHYSAGTHQAAWNGVSQYGMQVSSGVYFYRAESNGLSQTKKILLLK